MPPSGHIQCICHICKESCIRWPGPICGTCWAASCECGYVFDDVADAAGRWFTGVACAATNARTWARDGKGAYESVFGLTFSLLGAWWDISECVVCAGRSGGREGREEQSNMMHFPNAWGIEVTPQWRTATMPTTCSLPSCPNLIARICQS